MTTERIQELKTLTSIDEVELNIKRTQNNRIIGNFALAVIALLMVPLGLLMFIAPGLAITGIVWYLARRVGSNYKTEMAVLLERKSTLAEH